MQSSAAIAQDLARRDAENRRKGHSQTLYNGSHDEPLIQHYNSLRYLVPPDGETLRPCEQDEHVGSVVLLEKRGPIHHYNGELQVYDIWDAPKEKWAEYRKARKDPERRDKVKPPQKNQIKTTCNAVASFIAGNYGNRGIVVLTGDPEQDSILRQQAKTLYIKYDMRRCEKIVSTYHEYVANFKAKAQNIGNRPRRMGQIEQRAQQKLDIYRKQTDHLDDVIECTAPDCGFWVPNSPGGQEAMAQHIESQHGGNIVDQAGQFIGKMGMEPADAPSPEAGVKVPAIAAEIAKETPATERTYAVIRPLSEEEFRAKVKELSAEYDGADEDDRQALGDQLQALEARRPARKAKPVEAAKPKKARARPKKPAAA